MEEDNRSYHPTTSIGPFHFRQSYQQQFDHDELTTYSNKTEFITMKIDQKLPSLKYLLSTTNNNTNTTDAGAGAGVDRAPPRAICPVRGGGRGMVLVAEKGLSATATGAGVDRAPHHAPPRAHNPAPAPCPVHGGVRGMVLLVAEKEEDHSHHHHHHHQHQVSSSKRGMVPVQEQESEQRHRSYSAATTSTSTTANGTNNARMNRLLVETHGLFYDYQRRSYRQSLTEQAKELLEQAAAASSGDDYDASLVNLALYSDALQLCQKSIQDHDGNNNDRNNTVGGSYLITGDIRIRRKVELLAAKIYCLRASLLYKNNLYTKCLDDCNSAIKIWNRLEQSSIGRRQLRRKIKQKQQSQSSSSSQSQQQQQQQQRLQPRRRLLSHKHLYLLKAKALAGLGRYNDASKWLLCKNQVPYKHFDGKSQLIQNTGTMYNVLYEISNRDSENEKITTPPPSTAATNTTTNRRKENIIPTNQNVWPILIHNVQQRLLEGITTNTTAITAAAAATTMTATTATATSTNSGSYSNSNSCTNNAIYQLLRNGPVLFNHV